jgi:hypothetical protein
VGQPSAKKSETPGLLALFKGSPAKRAGAECQLHAEFLENFGKSIASVPTAVSTL